MSMPTAGDLAPEVALPDEHGTIHRLADRGGTWTVVYFFPRAGTPGCTTEACEFRDVNDAVAGRGAAIWGISTDTGASQAAFRAQYGLPFTLLSDEDHAAAEAWGAWQLKKNAAGVEAMGIVRSSFLVDPEGRVARVWPKVSPEGHATEVLEALEEAQRAASGS